MRAPTVVLFLALAGPALGAKVAVTPVQKVLSLMEDLKAKNERLQKEEEVNFSRFTQWCGQTKSERDAAVDEADATIERCDADIAAMDIEISRLSDEINVHNFDIDTWTKDQKAATFVRTNEASDYTSTLQNYEETNMALEKAIEVIRAKDVKIKQDDSALIQVSRSSLLQSNERLALEAFLQDDGVSGPKDDVVQLSNQEHKAYAYEFQSQNIVNMLQDLHDKFRKEQRQLMTDEQERKVSYEQMMQTLTAEVKRANLNVERKTKERGEDQQTRAAAVSDKADANTRKAADQQYLEELKEICEKRSAEFPMRQQLRKEENEAISKAIEIISSPTVAGAADKHLPEFLQVAVQTMNPLQERALEVIENASDRLGSKRLELLAQKMQANPFAKVTKMIEEMIFALRQEAREEAERHGWCQAELQSNKVTRDAKTKQVAELQAEIEEIKANIAQTKEHTTQLQEEVAESLKQMAKAEENRAKEKAENEETIADAKAAQEAVEQALAVLKEFYAKAGQATALNQLKKASDDAPVTWDSSFNAEQDSKTGIVGMVEVIHSDFARLESQTTEEEAQAESDHKAFMQQSRVDNATKEATIEGNNEKVARLSDEQEARTRDLEGTEAELKAAMDYYEKLKPTCVTTPVSYEERVQMREEEIQSLKEALTILEGSAEQAAGAAGTITGAAEE